MTRVSRLIHIILMAHYNLSRQDNAMFRWSPTNLHCPLSDNAKFNRTHTPSAWTSGGGNFYPPQPGVQPHYEGDYTATATQPQAVYDEGHDSRSKAPPSRPADYSNRLCRFPRCTRVVFFDRRVNEYREWCSDQHMQAAIKHGVERPCSYCQTFPRRNGHRHCSEVCRYRGH
ncbi:hypothetical protein BGY98DRAFT_178013 [Russula aff. rugulosa BPL654]|nr:hypothetical protein BGY98DRAFT_178013 [Russula aff. rugulosa BPL654]